MTHDPFNDQFITDASPVHWLSAPESTAEMVEEAYIGGCTGLGQSIRLATWFAWGQRNSGATDTEEEPP
jgi:hypothetical protein